MAGSFTSRVTLAVLAAGALIATATTETITRTMKFWRVTTNFVVFACDYALSLIRPAKPNAQNLSAWRRCLERAEAGAVHCTEKRRPLVSPRWRMCPST